MKRMTRVNLKNFKNLFKSCYNEVIITIKKTIFIEIFYFFICLGFEKFN